MQTPEQLKQVWTNAHRLLKEFGWSKAKVNQYIHEQTGLPDLPSLVSSAFPAEASAPESAPGIAGTALTHFGHGASLGFSDELAGLVSALGGEPTVARQGLQATPLPGAADALQAKYVAGRDQSRNYLAAGQEANPLTALISEISGGAASGAAVPVGAAATGADLLPAMLAGGAAGAPLGAAIGAGYAGDTERGGIAPASSLVEPALRGAEAGMTFGAGGALVGRTLQTTANPAAARGEEVIAAESGNPSATAAYTGRATTQGEQQVVQALESLRHPGLPAPMLAEGGPVLRTEAAKFVARSNPKARELAKARVKGVLDEVTAAKFAPKDRAHTPLTDIPVTTPGVNEVAAKYMKLMPPSWRAKAAPYLKANQPLPWRLVNDLSMELESRASSMFKGFQRGVAGNSSTYVPREYSAAAHMLDMAMRNDVPAFGPAQAEVAPLIQREQGLKKLYAELSQGRGRIMPSPGTGAPGHAAKEVFMGATWARNARAARTLVDVLFTPRDPEAQIEALHALRQTFPLTAPGGVDPIGALFGATATKRAQEQP